MKCPRCQSENIIKNGSIRNGKQKYGCRKCKRQSVGNHGNEIISSEIKMLADGDIRLVKRFYERRMGTEGNVQGYENRSGIENNKNRKQIYI